VVTHFSLTRSAISATRSPLRGHGVLWWLESWSNRKDHTENSNTKEERRPSSVYFHLCVLCALCGYSLLI
jgi:hypothetical protein